jgi:hypothetical protein
VALSGKELGDEERRTPRGFEIWRRRKEFKDPVKGELGQLNQATQDGEPLGRLTSRSQVSEEGLFVRMVWKPGSGSGKWGTRQGDEEFTAGCRRKKTSSGEFGKQLTGGEGRRTPLGNPEEDAE